MSRIRQRRDSTNSNSINIENLSQRLERLTSNITAGEKSITKLTEFSSEEMSSITANFATHQATINSEIAALESQVSVLEGQVAAISETSEAKLQEALQKGSESVEAWALAQKELARLEAPVALWGQRAKGHADNIASLKKWTVSVGALGLFSIILVIFGSYNGAQWLLSSENIIFSDPNFQKKTPTLSPIFNFKIGITFAACLIWLTMYFWLMKIMVRRLIAEQHLAIDASARAAMTQTYLGLIKESAATDAERAIVMGALFQQVSGGISGDDGPPQISLPALVAAIVGGKSPVT